MDQTSAPSATSAATAEFTIKIAQYSEDPVIWAWSWFVSDRSGRNIDHGTECSEEAARGAAEKAIGVHRRVQTKMAGYKSYEYVYQGDVNG